MESNFSANVLLCLMCICIHVLSMAYFVFDTSVHSIHMPIVVIMMIIIVTTYYCYY